MADASPSLPDSTVPPDQSTKATDASTTLSEAVVAGEPTEGATPPAPKPAADPGSRFLLFAAIPSWLVSMVLHIVLLFALAFLTVSEPPQQREYEIQMGNTEETPLEETLVVESPALDPQPTEDISDIAPSTPIEVQPTELITDAPPVLQPDNLEAAQATTELDPLGQDVAPTGDLLRQIGSYSGTGLEGRGQASRAQLVRQGGGTPGSEAAVASALKWLKNHQNPDGSWSFQHLGGNCPCPDLGTIDAAFNGATAMALLPFLGAGHTHREGEYQREVQAGLYYLLSHQKTTGTFWEPGGNLYSHGLCAIVLSEAFAMTQDQALMRPAQAALDYIAVAQDPVGGGWRYVARQPGDTSVAGWQLMALKSGRMAYLHVDPSVFAGATRFLDSVQTDSGSGYGYMDPGDGTGTTAVGLLCRMYLGWGREEPALQRGVQRLSKSGPSRVDMYYNYYATQVMRHFEGEVWDKWNKETRDFLVESQEQRGHLAGSWYMGKNHSSVTGGRLYCTAMAAMILEVYYRHLPLYRQQATEDDFEL